MLTLTTLDILLPALLISSSSHGRAGDTEKGILCSLQAFPTCIELFCLVCRVARNLVDLPVALAPLVQEGGDRVEEEEEDEAQDDDLLQLDAKLRCGDNKRWLS